jgi:hypothetical protein
VSQQPYLRVTLTDAQRRARLRSLVLGMVVGDLLLAVLLLAGLVWFTGAARWALLVAALVPLVVSLLALRGILLLARAQAE